ncbi:unnamed protein product [Hymenolepis diminuta]|uniref:Uncharacterized protein n=1 Tax=Hymenolepis diminuta TaxID=6216 RepID=A0A564YSI0_HYMDI|nr:unnamed protein product [Hymenolepis diminuta]
MVNLWKVPGYASSWCANMGRASQKSLCLNPVLTSKSEEDLTEIYLESSYKLHRRIRKIRRSDVTLCQTVTPEASVDLAKDSS